MRRESGRGRAADLLEVLDLCHRCDTASATPPPSTPTPQSQAHGHRSIDHKMLEGRADAKLPRPRLCCESRRHGFGRRVLTPSHSSVTPPSPPHEAFVTQDFAQARPALAHTPRTAGASCLDPPGQGFGLGEAKGSMAPTSMGSSMGASGKGSGYSTKDPLSLDPPGIINIRICRHTVIKHRNGV